MGLLHSGKDAARRFSLERDAILAAFRYRPIHPSCIQAEVGVARLPWAGREDFVTQPHQSETGR